MGALDPLPPEDLEDVLVQVGRDWERVRGKNVFLTGGSGFFGSWLLETLLFAEDRLGLGVRVWALSRDPERFLGRLPHLAGHAAVRPVGGGVEGFALPGEKMDFVIHSMVPDPGMPLPEMEEWFRRGTGRLLELAARHKSEGFLLCSTGAVYLPQNRPLSEEDPLIPLDAPLSYGRIRRQVEDQCVAACKQHGIPLRIARGFAMAGPRLPENAGFALADFLRDAREGRPIQIKGSGDAVRSYLYASDLATWLWKILFQGKEEFPYNVGSDQGISIQELAKTVANLCGLGTTAPSRPPSGASRYVPATRVVATYLALARRVNLKDAIQRSMKYAQQGFMERHLA